MKRSGKEIPRTRALSKKTWLPVERPSDRRYRLIESAFSYMKVFLKPPYLIEI